MSFLGEGETKTLWHLLLDPTILDLSPGVAGLILAVCVPVMLGGSYGVWRVVRRMGPPGGELSTESLILGLPLAFVAMLLPDLVTIILFKTSKPHAFPLFTGMLEALVAAGCILALRHHPYERKDAPPRTWTRYRKSWPVMVALVWVLSFPLMQAGVMAGVSLSTLMHIPVAKQAVLQELSSSTAARHVAGWYTLAVLGAPLREEFVFRLVLFGGLKSKIGSVPALIISVGSFVAVHGVIAGSTEQAHQLYLVFPLAGLALLLTALYTCSRSIWPPVLFHMLHNGAVATIAFAFAGS